MCASDDLIEYPEQLRPTSTESFSLPDGSVVRVPKATAAFRRWTGDIPEDTYGGKALIDCEGAASFAELVTLRLLENEGWEGVWVDTYRNKFRRGYWGVPTVATLPPDRSLIMERIHSHRGSGRSGTWDIFAWRGDDILFVECKRAGEDAIRPSQITWLAAALADGHPNDTFLIVEWTLV